MTETEFAFRSSGNADMAKAMYSSLKCLQADDVADAVIYVISAPHYVQVYLLLLYICPA